MDNIVFSFIIPIYNAEKYLRRCLDSLLNQDFSDIEIICVNDGSTDKSLEILNEYKNNLGSKMKIISQENKGIGAARNEGIKHAVGQYIWFIDNDDCIKSNCLKSLLKILEETSSEILEVGYVHEYYESNPLNDLVADYSYKRIGTKYAFYFNNDYPWSKIYSHKFLKELKIFFPDVFGEDTATIYWLYANASVIYQTNCKVYAWLMRSDSFSSYALTSKHFKTTAEMLNILKSQSEIRKEYKDEFEYIILEKCKIFIRYFEENNVASEELKQEKEDCIVKIKEIQSTIPENFYEYLNSYINERCTDVQHQMENTASWKITSILRKTKALFRKLKLCK